MAITYNYSPDWIGRDTQPDGSDLRIIRASDFLTEWTAIQTAFASAIPAASPTITGTASFENVSISGSFTLSGYNNSNWDTAFGWGDHAAAGYALDASVPANDGTGATGTWAISISGNAATATSATSATTATNCSRSVTAGSNLTGGGALTGNVSLALSDNPSVSSVVLGSWTVYDSGTTLYFQYNGNNVFKISSTGAITAENEVTAFGSV